MKIIEALNKKPKGKDLADRIVKEVRVRALNKLEHVRDLFPHFTDHSIRHGEGVISILDWLIPDTVKEQLNEWELYFLIAAAYLHDIGMVEGCPGMPEGEEWEEFYSSYRDLIRQSGQAMDESLVRDKQLMERFENETGRNAIYLGKITKQYQKWKKIVLADEAKKLD